MLCKHNSPSQFLPKLWSVLGMVAVNCCLFNVSLIRTLLGSYCFLQEFLLKPEPFLKTPHLSSLSKSVGIGKSQSPIVCVWTILPVYSKRKTWHIAVTGLYYHTRLLSTLQCTVWTAMYFGVAVIFRWNTTTYRRQSGLLIKCKIEI